MAFGNQLDYFISFLLFSTKAVKLIHSLLHCVYLGFQATPKLFEPNVSYLCVFLFDSIFHFRFLLHLIRKENIWGFEAAADAMQFQDTSSRSSCINLQLWTFAKCYHLMRFATQFPSIISSYMNKPPVNPRHFRYQDDIFNVYWRQARTFKTETEIRSVCTWCGLRAKREAQRSLRRTPNHPSAQLADLPTPEDKSGFQNFFQFQMKAN